MQKLLLLAIAAGVWVNVVGRTGTAGLEQIAAGQAVPAGAVSRDCRQDAKPLTQAPYLVSQASTEIGPIRLSLSVRVG